VQRYSEFKVLVVKEPKLDLPIIRTDLPDDATLSDVLVAIAGFNESWLHANGGKPGSFTAKAFAQFWDAFVGYYSNDPTAVESTQSLMQAPLKAYVMAQSNAIGLMGLAD
jgi:hypothetical protein